jgi:hypothetical protein
MERNLRFALIPALAVLADMVLCGCASPARWEPAYEGRTARSYARAEAPAAPGEAAQEAKPALQAPPVDPDRTGRIMIYNAELSLVVGDISGAESAIEQGLKPLGAYMQSMNASTIVMKVPAARFEEAIALVEKLGEVTNKVVMGEDVTEQMRDLDIRLKNALEVRARLAKMLDQAQKMEDALRIEKELERVTETIELLKGKIRFLETNAAFSTLTVRLNSPEPQRNIETEIPFPWVRALGGEIGTGRTGEPDVPWLGSGVAFDLPEGFIRYVEADHVTRAMSGDGVLILAARHENFRGGATDFWVPFVRRALAAGRAIALQGEPQEIKLKSGASAVLMAGSRSIGPKRYGYLLALIPLKGYVYTFEAWGESDPFEAQRAKLMEAIDSLRP